PGDREWPSRSTSATPEETGVMAHFYSFDREDSSMGTTLEQTLSRFEGAKRPYDKLVNGEMLTGDVRYAFASFLGLMVVRTVTYRRIAAKIFSYWRFPGDNATAPAGFREALGVIFRQALVAIGGVRRYCLWCCNGSSKEVELCVSKSCARG